MTLEKALVGRFRLPRVRPGGKAPNRELPPKSGDITCMTHTQTLTAVKWRSRVNLVRNQLGSGQAGL